MSPEQDYSREPSPREPGSPEIIPGFDLTDDALEQDYTQPYDPDILKYVDDVLGHQPKDNLEERMSSRDDDEDVLLQVQDWRTLSPDDPKGEFIQCRITAAVARKIDHLIAKTRGEVWSTRPDFLREAIWMYVRSVIQGLQTNDPTLVTMIAEADLAGRALFHSKRRARLEKAMVDVAAYLTDLVNLDDYEEAHRSLLELAYKLRRIQVSSWRRQWLLSLNSLPILKVVARVLDMNGWDIPVEFYPAAGKSPIASVLPPLTPLKTPSPPAPGEN